MSVDLNSKLFTNLYGTGKSKYGGDLLSSGKWQYAIYDKTPLDKAKTNEIFGYYQSHAFSNAQRYAHGLTSGFDLSPADYQAQQRKAAAATAVNTPYGGQMNAGFGTSVNAKNPYAGTPSRRGADLARFSARTDIDHFKHLRVGDYGWSRGKITAGADGAATRTIGKQVAVGPKVPYTQQKSKIEYSTQTGRLLNNAFVDDAAFEGMTDVDKAFYGLTRTQARQLDPNLDKTAQVVDAAYQYRRGRSRKKTGIGSIVGTLASTALPVFGALALGPIGGAIGGAISSGIQGGNLGDIAKGGITGYIGGQGAQLTGGAGGGNPYSDGGALGGAIQGTTNGANNVGFLNDLFKGGSDLIGNLGEGFSDIFKGGTGGLTDFLSGGGKAGQLGDLLNAATGGQSGGIGNILSGISGGNLGQILQGAGGLGILDGLLGATPGINPSAGAPQPTGGGGGGSTAQPTSGGGGTYQTVGGQAPQQGGQLGGLLGLLASGYLSQHSTGEVRDEIKSGRDRAIGLADPLADQRSTFASQLGALMADPSQRVPELPGYQFRFDQGQKAMQRAADAGGLAGSGNALIAAAEYGQNFAQAAYDSEFKKLYDLSSGSTAAAEAASNAGNQLALLEYGKYRGYSGLISQATGGAIPNPGGNQQIPQQGSGGSGGLLEQIISSLLGSNSNPPSGNDAGNPYAPGGAGADNSGGGLFGTNSGGISQFARLQ